MAHRSQLARQRRQELLGRKRLMHEINGIADKEFGKAHRCGHLDAALCAGPQDADTSGDEHGDNIDQDEYQQELCTD
jgi:hypothetical protein